MKKILLLLSLIVCFASCSKTEFLNDYNEIKEAQYNQAFESNFGKIANNHDWGFGVVDYGTTRAANVNGNLWYQDWVRPVNITDEEKTKVVAEFSKVRKNEVNSVHIDWNNYWVQQVYKGEATYNDGFGNSIGVASSKMNKLIAYNSNYKETVWWPEYKEIEGGYEHVNNFNDGNNTTEYTDDVTHEKFIGTTLMVNMNAEGIVDQFGYHNSVDSKDHFEYIILEIDGAYYVGFDFYATHPEGQEANKNMDVARDWIFNDWIVKISPAKRNITYKKRIICEDLGAIGDWDFNDVVFDALIKDGKTYIKLLAAGGTLELTVAGKEVHSEFGIPTSTMVNTNNGTVRKDPVEFEIDFEYLSYNDIPVIVRSKNGANVYTTYELKTKIGAAPQKIAVATDFEWCDERESIEDKYPAFKTYVGDPTLSDWWK